MKVLLNPCYWIAVTLLAVGLYLLFCETVDADDFASLIASQLLGLGFLTLLYKLVRRWEADGSTPELDNL